MIEEKVRKLIEDPVRDMGISIDKVCYEKEGNQYFLRVIIDREKIIDIDTVVEVTKVINPILDEHDIIQDNYVLDVSTKEKGELL